VVSGPGPRAPAGWYDDPGAPGIRRYWNGEAWGDPPATELDRHPIEASAARRPRIWPAGLILAIGAVGVWFAQTYKPTVSNELGLNGNTFVLKPGSYHLIVIVSIVLPVIGGIRLLMAGGGRRTSRPKTASISSPGFYPRYLAQLAQK